MPVDRDILRHLAEHSIKGWGGVRESYGAAQIARDLGMSEARVALTLKAAEKQGLAVPTSSRLLQIRYVVTEKGEQYLGLDESRDGELRSALQRLRRRLGL